MPDGSEIQTEGAAMLKLCEASYVDRRNQQQIGVGGAERMSSNVVEIWV